MSQRKQLTERTATPFNGVTVDREKGTISNVLVCGFDSANGRRYSADVLRSATSKYEGRPVNCDHASEATVDRRLGWLSGVQAGNDGRPRATLNILKNHPMAARVFEAAERNPSLYGLSHVAMCQSRMESGVEVIESIEEVVSVDLVADPATTHGLHESRKGTSMKTLKIKLLIEKLAPKISSHKLFRLKRLQEMEGMGELDVPVADDANPDESAGVTDAFISACMSVINKALKEGSLDPKEALKRLKKLMDAHGDINGDGKVDNADVEDADEDDETKPESKKKPSGKAIMEALDVVQKLNLKADKDDLNLIAMTPKESRESIAKKICRPESLPGEKPQTTARESQGQGGASSGTGGGAKPAKLSEGWNI